MKLNSTLRTGLLVALAAAAAAAAGTATAGSRIIYPATINDPGHYAVGAIADARGSVDNQQWIGCYNNASQGGCYATNAAGTSRSCSTSNPALLDVIRSISGETYVYFVWNTDGSCSYIYVENSSRFKPAAVSGT